MKKLVLVAACLLVVACAEMQQFAMTPEEREQHALTTCTDAANKTWDLGTGRAADIKVTAPGFFALRRPGWTPPMPADIDREENARKQLDKKNFLRLHALKEAASTSFRVEPVKVDDVEVDDIVSTKPYPRAVVHFVPVGDKAGALLVTPGKCPHVVAKDTCKDGKLHTTLDLDGTVSCLGPYSTTEDYVSVSVNNGASQPLTFGELLTNDDVADVLQIVRARIVALLRRKGVVADDEESGASVVAPDAALADREPALAELAVASTLGTVPAGPALRRQDPITLRGAGELEYTKALCAAEYGFSLHAATTASAGDAAGREALCKYILRPPIAQERIQLVADDLVRLTLKRPFSDGMTCSQCLLGPRWTW